MYIIYMYIIYIYIYMCICIYIPANNIQSAVHYEQVLLTKNSVNRIVIYNHHKNVYFVGTPLFHDANYGKLQSIKHYIGDESAISN